MKTSRLLAAALIGVVTPTLRAQTASFPPALEVLVPKPPTVAHGNGQTILPYELHISNFTNQSITLRQIDVLPADRVGGPTLASSSAPLMTLADSTLLGALARPGARLPPAEIGRASCRERV